MGVNGEGNRLLGPLRVVAELTRLRITLCVTLTAAMGHILFTEAPSTSVFLPTLGVFLLTCGSVCLSQVQDARIDTHMERTRARPIPSGRVDRGRALSVALAFIVTGYCALAGVGVHTRPLLALGTLALLWCNAVYIPLKRVTAFAIIPGSLIGAIPPVIGWVSAGGMWWDPSILIVASFLFLWQVPHFWCLMLMTGEDQEKAGLPTITRVLSRPQLIRVTSIWILTLAVAGLLLAGESGLAWPWYLGMVAGSLWLCASAVALLRGRQLGHPGMPAFARINVYLLLVVVLMTGNAVS